MSSGAGTPMRVAQDELGFLWVSGDAVPRFETPNASHASPGALVFWTPKGVGLWIHPKSLRDLPSISRLEMEGDTWMKVNEVHAEWPPFIKEHT